MFADCWSGNDSGTKGNAGRNRPRWEAAYERCLVLLQSDRVVAVGDVGIACCRQSEFCNRIAADIQAESDACWNAEDFAEAERFARKALAVCDNSSQPDRDVIVRALFSIALCGVQQRATSRQIAKCGSSREAAGHDVRGSVRP